MKKILAFAIVAGTVLALASCQKKEITETPTEQVPAGYHMATITVGSPATKAVMDNSGAASWQADDFVYVAASGEVIRFTARDNSTGSSKDFHAAVADNGNYTAVIYNRYGTVSAYDGTVFTASIPASQNGATGNFIAAAKSDDVLAGGPVALEQLTSGFMMTIPSDIAGGLSSITLSVLGSSDQPVAIAGNVSINPGTKAVTGADVKAVTVSKTFTAGETVFIATAPFSGAKLRLAFAGNNGAPYNYVRTVALSGLNGAAGQINNLGTVSFANFENTIINVDTTTDASQTAAGKEGSSETGDTTTINVSASTTVECVLNGNTKETAVINVSSIAEGAVLVVDSDSAYDAKGTSNPTNVEIALPANTAAGAFEGLVIDAPNAHVTVTVGGSSVDPATYFKSITATTADTTLEIGAGVTVDFLTVEKGSVLVKYGATVNNITMGTAAGALRVEYYSNIAGSKTNGVDTYAGEVVDEWIDLYEGGGVCRIGSTVYETLEAAFAAVPTDGTATTIQMLADYAVPEGLNVAASQSIVLELNGKTVSGNTESTTTYALITNKGTLVIQDCTDTNADGTGNGLITTYISNADQQDVPGYASNTITNNGTLTVKSGKIVNNGNGYACYAIDNQTNGGQYTPVVTIDGGRMQQMNAYTYAVRMFCNSTTNVNTLVVNGGVIEGGYALWLQTPNNKANRGSLTINGGELIARDGAALYVGGTKADNSNISISVTGGSIKGTGAMIQGPLSGTYGSVAFSGGKFVNVQCGANVEGFISGGIYGTEPAAAYVAEGYGVVANDDSETQSEYPYEVLVGGEAKIGGVVYPSLVAALAAAKDGETVNLLMDIDFSQASYADYKWAGSTYNPLKITADNITLDLGGHTLSNMGNCALVAGYILAADGRISNFTIQNGRLMAGKTSGVTNSYVLGIAGVTGAKIKNITTNGGINVYTNSTAEIEDCTINGTKYYSVCSQTGSEVTIKNCSVTKNTDSSVATKAMFWIDKAGKDSDCATTENPTGAYGASSITIKSGSYNVDAENGGILYLASGLKPTLEGGHYSVNPYDCADFPYQVAVNEDITDYIVWDYSSDLPQGYQWIMDEEEGEW